MKTIIIALTLALAPSVWATSVAYSFSNPTGVLGTSETYTSAGVSITAYGFDYGHAAQLFGNSNGLGLENNDGQIGYGFVQLDLESFWALDPTGVTITIGDVQPDESWEIFGSNTLGSIGTEIQTGSNDAPVSTALALSADNYEYLSVTASKHDDVVLSGLTGASNTSTPEPGSFAMIGIGAGLLGLASIKNKKRKS